ncbi:MULTISPECIES: DUF3613 domain-containing protein [Pseudomonas fluorescens group]|uniref:Exported protein n=2 Tax=Pseudomonas fluorescens TaxID=294 RepID=C3K7F5_PSEFS|nr:MULTISPECIES: DUF3613 domain-containing protein [Pseudomonas fluorescens group]MBZ6458937.1 DUF3613 domain-containing protein [Pseudomonas fluorescens group sp.]MBZ6465219.1 DUF3613 domain-containing protein [Pseudomonas fluorescens group sp.]MBZ6469251.1 DUF3613 domain-containing protein [Pseudomonas fluorescens group sp.]MCF5664483.1 DUF3613 domain-containing protein [Pseudomonas marginalis]MCM2378967.1 DUF3613 domain-containing protein [Pseudomonas marginalis]
MKVHYLVGLALLPLSALAIEPGPSSPQQAETENWMALQINGRAASPTPQRTTPAEREQALQRWLDSHKHPIPEFFESPSGGSSKGGNSQ